MDVKVKGSIVKLGDELYLVSEGNLEAGVQRVVVTTLALDSDNKIVFHINKSKYPFYKDRYTYITRSEKKAQKVYQIWLNRQKRRNERYNQEQLCYKENQYKLDDVSKSYIGKTVMVRFRRKNQDTTYEKAVIHSLTPTYKKGEYLFCTSPSTNQYLTTREGKNWYFWTELDELKQKKADIEKRIEDLEKENRKWNFLMDSY